MSARDTAPLIVVFSFIFQVGVLDVDIHGAGILRMIHVVPGCGGKHVTIALLGEL